jgi:hypothetical protein
MFGSRVYELHDQFGIVPAVVQPAYSNMTCSGDI